MYTPLTDIHELLKLKMQTEDYCSAIGLNVNSRNYDKEQELLKQLRDKQLDCLQQLLDLRLDQVKLLYCLGNYRDCRDILDDMFSQMQKREQDLYPNIWGRYYFSFTKVLMAQNDPITAKEKFSEAVKWFSLIDCLQATRLSEELKKIELALDVMLQEKVKQPYPGTLFKPIDEDEPTLEDISSDEDRCIIC